MKKLWLITLTLIMALTLCFGLTACGDKTVDQTVDQLQNELGALLEGGNFEEGSVLNLNDITAEKATEIFEKLEENGISINDETKTYIYDIFVTKDNAEVQPDGKVKVTVPMPADEKAEGYNVYHMKDNGTVEVIPSTYNDGKVSFETDSFSWYVFTPTYNYVNVNVHFTGDLYVGSNLSDGVTIHSSYKPLTQYSSVVSKGTYLVGEETTLELQINNQDHTFLGWYEAESFYIGNYDKPTLKDTPVSTETSYTFKTEEQEYAVYAVFAEKGGKLHFNANNNGGVITINGEAIEPNYTVDFKVGNSYSLNVIPNEGYRFVGWDIYGKMSYSTVKEASFNFVTKADERDIVAVFEPVVTGLTVDMDDLIYDVTLLEKYESISIPDFNAICEEGGTSEKWKTDYVIFGKIKSISNTTWGNMIIVDDQGNELHVFGLYSEDGTRYGKMEIKPMVGDFIAVHGTPYLYGTEPEMQKGYLLNATPILPSFENVTVHAYTPEGSSVLNADEYTVDVSALNAAKPGEHLVIYTYKENPEIKATVCVKVLAAEPVEFSAYLNADGTLLLDGVEIGPDYYEIFKDGYGKVTLTAVGAENTVFKGWYTGGDNNPTLISTDATYTFEFDKNTYVYAEFEYTATEIMLYGMNMGFDTEGGITEIWLPVQGTYDPSRILVSAVINGEPETLTADEYTIDLGGFNGTSPAKGDYVITFTYKANPELKATHIIRVIDEENMVSFDASSAAGGRVTVDKPYDQYNKGEQVTVTVELRSESDYEFLGWYTVDASGAVGTTCVSTERTYTITLNETTYLYAKIEPKVTYLDVVVGGYPTNPAKIPLEKFSFDVSVYACGALGLRNELTADDYTVDMGGLDVANAAVGKYTVTYTYKADTSIKYELVVWVWNEEHSFRAYTNSPDCGDILFEGGITADAGGQYIDGEEITVTAIEKDGFAFLGWYKVINKETHEEFELITTEQVYTFVIDADTTIMAKFDSPVVDIYLSGNGFSYQNGKNVINVYRGDQISIDSITVYGTTFFGDVALDADDYTVDLGGLDLNNPAAGSYVITYTYKENTELTACIYVTVLAPTYVVKVEQYHNAGYVSGSFEYEGNKHFDLYLEVEEGKTVILKATERTNYSFVGWYATDYNNYGEWEIYSTDATVAVKAKSNIILAPAYMPLIVGLKMHLRADIYEAGVMGYDFSSAEFGHWDEELGCYVARGHIDLYANSEYATDIERLFENFNIISVDSNGSHRQISYEDLTFGDYNAEEGWYEIKVSYGSFTMTIDVMVVPAENA